MGQARFVTDTADDRAALATGNMGLEPDRLHAFADVVDLVRGDVLHGDDDHVACSGWTKFGVGGRGKMAISAPEQNRAGSRSYFWRKEKVPLPGDW